MFLFFLIKILEFLKTIFIKYLTVEWYPSANSANGPFGQKILTASLCPYILCGTSEIEIEHHHYLVLECFGYYTRTHMLAPTSSMMPIVAMLLPP